MLGDLPPRQVFMVLGGANAQTQEASAPHGKGAFFMPPEPLDGIFTMSLHCYILKMEAM